MLTFRLADHRGYINNQNETHTSGKHFNSPGKKLGRLEYYSFRESERKVMNSIEKKGKSVSLERLSHSTEA